MNDREQDAPRPASAAQLCRLWSGHVDSLERHLSANVWTLAVAMALAAYPVARIVISAMLDRIVPDVVRTVLNLI